MNSYKKDFPNTRIESYEIARKIIDRVEQMSNSFKIESSSYHFHFKIGDVTCTTKSIDEFIQEAYGAESFKLVSLQMLYYLPNNQHFSVNYLLDVSISASNKCLLESIVNKIELEEWYNSAPNKSVPMENETKGTINNAPNINNIITMEYDDVESNKKNDKSLLLDLILGIVVTVLSGIILHLLLGN